MLADPELDPFLKTSNWPNPSLNYSVLKSIGVDWTHGAYYGCQPYYGGYGYKIMLPNSPLLAGTGLGFYSPLSCTSGESDGTLISEFNDLGDPIIVYHLVSAK